MINRKVRMVIMLAMIHTFKTCRENSKYDIVRRILYNRKCVRKSKTALKNLCKSCMHNNILYVRELNQLTFFCPNFDRFSFVWKTSLFSPTEWRNASCVSSYVPNLSFALRWRNPHNAAVLPDVLPKVLLSCCEDACNTSSKYFPSAAPSVKIPLIIVRPSLASTCPWNGSLTLLPICCTILHLCDPKKGILPRLRVSITQYLVDEGGCDSHGTSRILIGASLCKSRHAPIVVFKSLGLFVFLCFLLGCFCKLVSLIARNKLFIMPPASRQVFHTISVYYPKLFRLIVALAWVSCWSEEELNYTVSVFCVFKVQYW